MSEIKLFDVIALLKPIPNQRLSLVEPEYNDLEYLPKGQIGTVVEINQLNDQLYYLVDFSDNQGCEYAMARLIADEMLVLHEELQLV